MCVGIIAPYPKKDTVHKPLSLEILQACEKSNSAGGGIAYVTNNTVSFKKGISAEEIFEIQKTLAPPYAIHFRIPTVGGADKRLCHPFPITRKAPLTLEGVAPSVLVHNGHWTAWKGGLMNLLATGQKMPEGPWTDTRAMAYLVAHYGPEILTLVDEKVAILAGNGSYRFFGRGWDEYEGHWFTNLLWKHHLDKPAPKPETSPEPRVSNGSIAAARAYFRGAIDGVEVSITPSSTVSDIDVIKEWAKWSGIRTEAVELAVAAMRKERLGDQAEEARASAEAEHKKQNPTGTLLLG